MSGDKYMKDLLEMYAKAVDETFSAEMRRYTMRTAGGFISAGSLVLNGVDGKVTAIKPRSAWYTTHGPYSWMTPEEKAARAAATTPAAPVAGPFGPAPPYNPYYGPVPSAGAEPPPAATEFPIDSVWSVVGRHGTHQGLVRIVSHTVGTLKFRWLGQSRIDEWPLAVARRELRKPDTNQR